jgi:hypothetical protein
MAEFPYVQDILNQVTVGPVPGVSHTIVGIDELTYDAYWNGTAAGGSVATMVIEVAGARGINQFGLFDSASAATLEVFDGPAVAGDPSGRAIISFGAGGVLTAVALDGDVHTATFVGDSFGFYLNSPTTGGGFFYSDTLKNTDGFDHMWAYRGKNIDKVQLPGLAAGVWTPNEFVLAFEDTYGGGDQDHNDFVVMVESVVPVPVPAAVLLGLLGLSAAGLRLRKFA